MTRLGMFGFKDAHEMVEMLQKCAQQLWQAAWCLPCTPVLF